MGPKAALAGTQGTQARIPIKQASKPFSITHTKRLDNFPTKENE